MTAQATIDLPQELYERVRQLAQRRQQAIPELIAEALDLTEDTEKLDKGFSSFASDTEIDDGSEPNKAVEREMQAYVAMHSRSEALGSPSALAVGGIAPPLGGTFFLSGI